jgi:ATP/maltotriose-dependent transcriptional regulator MalT
VEFGRQVLGFSTVIWGVLFRGFTLVDLGRLEEADRDLHRGLQLAREHHDVESLGWAHGNFAWFAYYSGDPGDALAHAREAVSVAERLGSSFSRIVAYVSLAAAHLVRGEWEEATTAAEDSLSTIRATRTGVQYEAVALSHMSEARLGAGDEGAARALAAEGIEIAAGQPTPMYEARCRMLLGRALSAGADPDPAEARRELERAMEYAEAEGLAMTAHIHAALAEVAALEGDSDGRRSELETARRLFIEQGATGRERRVARELEALPTP